MTLKHKRERGITLIALVITIIVLLILAAVSITTLTGDNGILTKAQTAKEETKKANEEEQRQLAMLNAATHTERYEYPTGETDKSGKPINVTIPSGFAPTGIEGEDTVEGGFVITDEKGNEFVWIPCGEEDDVKYSTIYYGSEEAAKQAQTDGTKQGKPGEYWKSQNYAGKSIYYTDYTWKDEGGNIESVKKYGGFYVARYEAGLPKELWDGYDDKYKWTCEKNGDSGKNTDYRRDATDIDGQDEVKYIPVSKKNTPSWNCITQEHAKNAAERMYKSETMQNGTVTSQLIDSYAWDTIVEWLKKDYDVMDSIEYGNYKNSKITVKGYYAQHIFDPDAEGAQNDGDRWTYANKYENDSTGNYKTQNENDYCTEIATGASEDTKTKNIYDLAGNMYEFTTEEIDRESVVTAVYEEMPSYQRTMETVPFPLG